MGPSRLPAFLLSLGIHITGILTLVSASRNAWLEPKPAPIRQRIAAERRRIIWYTRPVDLPPVAPTERRREGKPKLVHPAAQEIRADDPDPESRRQKILQSPPEIRLEADQALPNVVAWEPVQKPEAKRRFEPAPPPVERPQPKAIEGQAPEVAAAPAVDPAKAVAPLPEVERPRFVVPEREARRPAGPRAVAAEAAPEVATGPAVNAALAVQPLPELARPKFVLPVRAAPKTAGARAVGAGEAAPQVATGPAGNAAQALQPLPEVARPRFVLPEKGTRRGAAPRPVTAGEAAPDLARAGGGTPEAAGATVIVGLDPAHVAVKPPPGNRSAAFAAGPEAGNGNGGDAKTETAELRVPNLSIAPAPAAVRPRLPVEEKAAFRRQLLASTALVRAAAKPAGVDPVLRGSSIYTMTVDMPNITSYEGSWVVRFTELGGSSREDILIPPLAVRKVDPVYNPDAAAEGVEGKVVLYAVIRKDGRVEQVRLVQGIDERLDASAAAAFAKWEFQPATKNGVPVDLEAVVNIPFRLKPGRR